MFYKLIFICANCTNTTFVRFFQKKVNILQKRKNAETLATQGFAEFLKITIIWENEQNEQMA